MESQELIHCPYNFAHVILKHRMAAHLIKCRRQHPSVEFSTCPFNSTHDVPTPELQYHTENCQDRRKLDSFVYVADDVPPEPAPYNFELPPSNENWDDEPELPASYLDVKNEVLENQALFRVPTGMTKTARKAFSDHQVKKFGELSMKCSKNQ